MDIGGCDEKKSDWKITLKLSEKIGKSALLEFWSRGFGHELAIKLLRFLHFRPKTISEWMSVKCKIIDALFEFLISIVV